jgi:hypothetical protein
VWQARARGGDGLDDLFGAVCIGLGDDAIEEPVHVSECTDVTKANFVQSVEAGHTNQGAAGEIGAKAGAGGGGGDAGDVGGEGGRKKERGGGVGEMGG